MIGLAAYLFVLVTSFGLLLGRRAGPERPAPRGPPAAVSSQDGKRERTHGGFTAAQGVLVATYAALVTHTMTYAAFLEDPFTWVILGIAVATAPPAGRRVVAGKSPVAAEAAPATA